MLILHTTEIQFAFSLVRLDDIPSFLETVLEGIYTSQQWTTERKQGTRTSGFATLIVPTGEEDGSCNIVIDRKVVMKAIRKYGLSDLKLE